MRIAMHLRGLALIALFAGLFTGLLAACSMARVAYGNGEIVIMLWLHRYVDFDQDQYHRFKPKVDALFAWHRQTQLQDYVLLLQGAQTRVRQPVERELLRADAHRLGSAAMRILDQALPLLAELALELRDEQIAHLERKFADNNRKYREKYLNGTAAERREAQFKRVTKHAEYWFGRIDARQQAAIRATIGAAIATSALDEQALLEERMRRQAGLIALLQRIRARSPSVAEAQGMLRDFFQDGLNQGGDPRRQAQQRAYRHANLDLAVLIINQTNAAQKQHFVERTQRWIDDFQQLAQP